MSGSNTSPIHLRQIGTHLQMHTTPIKPISYPSWAIWNPYSDPNPSLNYLDPYKTHFQSHRLTIIPIKKYFSYTMDLVATILNPKNTINPSRNNSHPPQAIWNSAPNQKHMLRCHTEVSEYCFLDRIRIRIIFGIRILTEYEYE